LPKTPKRAAVAVKKSKGKAGTDIAKKWYLTALLKETLWLITTFQEG